MKYKICVSGSAIIVCDKEMENKTYQIGQEIARQGQVLFNGATTGFPALAVKGANKEGGMCIGISPAKNELEHTKHFRLPIEGNDVIVYTGFGYIGRDLLLIRSSDAVVFVCGRIGTLHEFACSFEDNKPIGILLGSGGSTQFFDDIIRESKKGSGNVVYDSDPKSLIKRLIKLTDDMRKKRIKRQKVKKG